jgi:hypothetical protein
MRNKVFCFLVTFTVFFSVKAQTWTPVGTGITGISVNTTWSLFAYDSVLYAGGWFDSAGGVNANDIAQWNGTNWATIGTGSSGYINAMASYKGNLYAGGLFDTIGGIVAHNIAMWNGSVWAPVGKGIKTVQYGPYTMAVYNGNLYVGGSFDSVDGKLMYGIAQWDGTTWSAVGTGIYAKDEEDGVFAMTVYNGELYVAGGFDSAGGLPVVSEMAKWNGTKWSNINGYTNGAISALAVYNGNLYAGGWLDTLGGIAANSIGMWNGTTWSALDSGLYGEPGGSQVNALAVYNGELYAGGYFDTINNRYVNCIAKWNGSVWTPVGSGISNGGSVNTMVVFNNSLYVGGGFDSAGGVYAKNIAMWTYPESVNEISDNNNIAVYPNPANDRLSIEMNTINNSMQYTIYDELGRQIELGKLPSAKNNGIDISTYPPGIYMISVTTATNKRYTAKFIKD